MEGRAKSWADHKFILSMVLGSLGLGGEFFLAIYPCTVVRASLVTLLSSFINSIRFALFAFHVVAIFILAIHVAADDS